jgi:hypothetical protein
MPIIRLENNKVIGILDDKKRIFKKVVWKSKHLFRTLDAWGIDATFFNEVLLPNNYIIQVYDKEENVVYETTAENIKKHGYFYHFKNKKEDYRIQIFLPRIYWQRVESNSVLDNPKLFSQLVL